MNLSIHVQSTAGTYSLITSLVYVLGQCKYGIEKEGQRLDYLMISFVLQSFIYMYMCLTVRFYQTFFIYYLDIVWIK